MKYKPLTDKIIANLRGGNYYGHTLLCTCMAFDNGVSRSLQLEEIGARLILKI